MENLYSEIQQYIDKGLYQGVEWKINYKKTKDKFLLEYILVYDLVFFDNPFYASF